MYTEKELIRDFTVLGIERGSVLMMHSAMSSIGPVEGGAETVIRALLAVLGKEGTLASPTMTPTNVPFDPANSPSNVGILSETIRRWPGAWRSLNPLHSVSAIGARALELTDGHDLCYAGCDEKSPYYKLLGMDATIMLLGVDMDRNTTMHTLEQLAQSSYLGHATIPAPLYPPYNGRGVFELNLHPGGHRDYIGLTPMLRREGVIREGLVGSARALLMKVRRLFDVLIPRLKDEPLLFLCKNVNCSFCHRARADYARELARKWRDNRDGGTTATAEN
ncbi:MAG: AAC(3) family N-acetyltransferase [Clostridiaceae bacterium]|nr:AAC(3) family N-acetyltransferase [Clostridiaceae bacterium]